MPDDQTTPHEEPRNLDALFGGITLALAIIAISQLKGAPFGPPGRLSDWAFPAFAAGLLMIVSLILVLRGMLFRPAPVKRWRPVELSIAALVLVAFVVGLVLVQEQQWGRALFLHIGPSELATATIGALAIAIAVARFSRQRAFAMVLVGLLVATVGVEISTGDARFTMGLPQLADGIDSSVLRLGLLVVADGLLCLASPSAYLRSYAQWVARWFDRPVSAGGEMGLRIGGAIAVVAACIGALALNGAVVDLAILLAIGLFGIVCKLAGANRLLLIMAFGFGPLLEENIRRALLISRGDPAVFVRWPIGAAIVGVTCIVIAGIALLSIRRNQNATLSASG